MAAVWTASTDTLSDIYLSVSNDGGNTFGGSVRVNDQEGDARASGEQPARVAIAPDKTIHVVWPARRDGHNNVLRYSSSRDGGRSFSPAVTVAGGGLHGARGWHALTVASDGTVHIVWLDGRNAPPHKHNAKPAPAAKSATTGAATTPKPKPMGPAPRQDIFHASWKPGSGSDGGSVVPAENPVAANVCYCCKTAVTTSGSNVYAAWRHIYPGSFRDIAMGRSNDSGATFDTPIRVSEDGWELNACPDDGPSLAADSHGGLHIVWPAMIPGDAPQKGVFYATLTPEQTFTARLRLDSSLYAAHPQIASDEHGKTAIVWDELDDSKRRIVLRQVANGVPGAVQTFEGAGVSRPVIAAGDGYWITLWSADGSQEKSVIEGRKIAFTSASTP